MVEEIESHRQHAGGMAFYEAMNEFNYQNKHEGDT